MSVTRSFRPSDGSINGSVQDSSEHDVERTVAEALAAADEISSVPPSRRRAWLDAVADALDEAVEELAGLADDETGLGMVRLRGEVGRAATQLRFYGRVAEEGTYLGVTIDHATDSTPELVRVNRPLGPVAVFGASNFPFAFGVLGHDTASALAAGCPVVVKAHPAHPLLSTRLVALATDALAAAGAPAGMLATVGGLAAGMALVEHPDVRAVGFTGSQAGGMALWRAANARDEVIPVYAEMGTINPVIATVGAMADLPGLVRGFVGSFTMGAGQFCTKPGLLLVPAGHGVAAEVGAQLAAAVEPAILLTEGIARAASVGVDDLVAAGASVVAEVPSREHGWSAGSVVLQTPAAALVPGSRLLEECFGPVSIVVEYASRDELFDLLGRLQGCLVGTVMTGGDGDDEAPVIVSRLASMAGRVSVDTWPTGVALTWGQHHGGPWPATSSPAHTSVGGSALTRWTRPVVYQSAPSTWLPDAGRPDNPWGVTRRVDGVIAAAAENAGSGSRSS